METQTSQKNSVIEIEDDGSHSKINDYIIIKFLDRGAQGKVKLCQKKNTKQIFAIKIHKQQDLSENDKQDMRREVNAIRQIGKHRNILNLEDYFEDADYIKKNNKGTYKATCIVLEYIENGCLFDYVKAMGGFHSAIARYYFKEHIQALKHIHENGVSHRDIKLENTLLDDQFILKICDFGFAGPVGQELQDNLGTQSYKAPEIYSGIPYYGEKADIFSSAVCFFIFCFGHYPFAKAVKADPYYKMFMNKNESFWNKHIATLKKHQKKFDFITPDFIELMNNMMNQDFKQRWDCDQILNCTYMTKKETTINVEINQELVSYNLSQYKKQVDSDRITQLQEIKNKRQQEQNVPGYQHPQGRAVPVGLVQEVQSIQEQYKEQLPEKVKFNKYIGCGFNNSSIKVVLGEDEVIPVILYILSKIELDDYQLSNVKISKDQIGKIVAEFSNEEESIKVVSGVEEIQNDESSSGKLKIFNISLARKEGEYLQFRNIFEAFRDLAVQFE